MTMVMFYMDCRKCGGKINTLSDSCGLGYSWSLYKCPHCGQLHAEKHEENGWIPESVKNDANIICI